MSRPDKCRWCGATIKSQDIEPGLVVFTCDSWVEDDGREYQWIKCKLIITEQRIAAAIDKAQRSIRFGLKANSSVTCVFAADMDRVVAILEGVE